MDIKMQKLKKADSYNILGFCKAFIICIKWNNVWHMREPRHFNHSITLLPMHNV